MGGFKPLLVLLVLFIIIPAATAITLDKAGGGSIVIHTLEGSGLHIIEIPEDSVPAVKGALYLKHGSTLELSVGSLEKAIVMYETEADRQESNNLVYYSFGALAAIACLFLLRKAWLPILLICIVILSSLSAFSADCEKAVVDSTIVFSCDAGEYVNKIINSVLKDYNSRSDAVLLSRELGMMDSDFIQRFSERVDEPGMKIQVHDYIRAVKSGFGGAVSEEQMKALTEGRVSYQNLADSL